MPRLSANLQAGPADESHHIALSRQCSDIDLPTPPPEAEIQIPDSAACLSTQIISADTKPLVAVIGVGYVGTHLVETFSRMYDVIGFDVSEQRVKDIRKDFALNQRANITSDPAELAEATHYLVSVPTLLLPNKAIDTSYLRNALSTVSFYLRPGATIVIESSVAVGMTRELVGSLASEKGCFVGMSPERVDPGRTEPPLHAIPKIISGLDDVVPGSLAQIQKLYRPVFDKVVPVSKPEVAEMTKLYENCQRMINIAYVNEMSEACISHGISPFEVCDAAATKPFGYMPFTPGVGVGGHCIPVNPYYLLSNSDFPLLRAATEKMWNRPAELARRTSESLQAARRDPRDLTALDSPLLRRAKSDGSVGLPSVLVVGIGFKRGESTLSNSPGLEFARTLAVSQKVNVAFADPLVCQESLPSIPKLGENEWTLNRLKAFDSIVVTVRQVGLDFEVLNQLKGIVKIEWWCS